MENDKTQLELLEQQKKELEIEVENLKEEAFLQQDNVDDLVGEDQSQTAINNAIEKTRAAAHKWHEKEDELNRIKRKIKNHPFRMRATRQMAANKFNKGKKTEEQRKFAKDIKTIMEEDEPVEPVSDDDATPSSIEDLTNIVEFKDDDDEDDEGETKKQTYEEWSKEIANSDDVLLDGGKRRRRKSRKKSKKRRRKSRRKSKKRKSKKKRRRKRRRTKKKRRRRR